MDKVRFGRALGFGARQAGKALAQAADAALKPDPTRRPGPAIASATQNAGETGRRVARKAVVYKRETKRFGQAMWGPVARASGVLWLELTGVFFGLFAFTAAVELYRHSHDFAATGAPRQRIWFAVGMLVVFGWFSVSSFLRARKRSRKS